MKKNAFYLYLLSNIDKVAEFQDGMTPVERANKKLLFCVLFMTIDRLAAEIAVRDGFKAQIFKACISMTYTDIYAITELIVKQPEILEYER